MEQSGAERGAHWKTRRGILTRVTGVEVDRAVSLLGGGSRRHGTVLGQRRLAVGIRVAGDLGSLAGGDTGLEFAAVALVVEELLVATAEQDLQYPPPGNRLTPSS